MEEKKQEKLPIDAKLLSDAVIELNISRRSVGLYPREHPITRESIEKAFVFLKRLFELRSSITIGIAKDVLVIDEYTLERKNPVFREFALSIHRKGIAAITFYSGLTIDELLGLHELITSKDVPIGKALVEVAEKKGLRHISLSPLDASKFGFIEDSVREDDADGKIWEDYVFGLLEGRLADSEAEGIILTIPPEDIASFMNEKMAEDVPEKTYDRVITTYLRKKEDSGYKRELFNRFISMVHNLSPGLKQQFLKRAFSYPSIDADESERLFSDLTEDDVEKVMKVFSEHTSLIPESLRNLIGKLTTAKKESGFFDMLVSEKAIVDDVEIDENVIRLFGEDGFRTFVTEEYQEELERMLRGIDTQKSFILDEVKRDCSDETVDRIASEVMVELLESDSTGREDYLKILTGLSLLVNDFLETGRFQEITDIYNTLYSHTLTGRFRDEATAMIRYFFSSEASIAKLIDAFKIWGRHDREGVIRLARVLKQYLTDPLLDNLSEETDSSIRKFLLYVLTGFRSDVIPEAVRRLSDERWYVVRNMIYLIRECGDIKYIDRIKPFVKHMDRRVSMEAVKALLHFNVPGAFPSIRDYLQSKDPELRDQAVRLVGAYRIRDAVPYLLSFLEKRDLFGTEAYYKISVVRALGEIGDSRTVDTLSRLYDSKSLLYRAAMEELKVEIFRSLQNYPFLLVRPLLERGLNSKNKEIRSISENLLRGGN